MSPGFDGPFSSHPLLTVSSVWAGYIIVAWAALAAVGLLRVFASLWQLRRLRRTCVAIDLQSLGPGLQNLIEECRKLRPVSILVSSRVQVPTAIGFLRPAILVPAWLADSGQAEELKYVLLHEMAHLQRWDDWTNLAQKLVKAVLFFHPGVWWIERKLSLDREMACDDAVLARTGAPRLYAQCLARVAEKSLLWRQIALAQAAVDRVRQLSRRVSRILDGNRPASTKLWRPAVPMVAALAFLSAVAASNTNNLVGVNDERPAGASSALASSPSVAAGHDGGQFATRYAERTAEKGGDVASLVDMAKFTPPGLESQTPARPAEAKLHPGRSLAVPATYRASSKRAQQIKAHTSKTPKIPEGPETAEASTSVLAQDGEGGLHEYGVVLLVVTSGRITSAGSMTWQINMWELRLPAPADHPTKPIPHKI